MTEHIPYDEYPKSALLLFADTIATRKAEAHDNETKMDNEEIRKRRAIVEEAKNTKTYGKGGDVF